MCKVSTWILTILTFPNCARSEEARGTSVRLPEDQLKLLLCGLSDSSLDMRSSVARFVSCLHFSSNAALLAAVQALVRAAAARPQDLGWVGDALRALGERFCHFVEGVMPKLLGDAQQVLVISSPWSSGSGGYSETLNPKP